MHSSSPKKERSSHFWRVPFKNKTWRVSLLYHAFLKEKTYRAALGGFSSKTKFGRLVFCIIHSSSKEKAQTDRAALGGFPSKRNGGFVFCIMHSSSQKNDRAAFGGFPSKTKFGGLVFCIMHSSRKTHTHTQIDRAVFCIMHSSSPKKKERSSHFWRVPFKNNICRVSLLYHAFLKEQKKIEPLLEGSLQKQNLEG